MQPQKESALEIERRAFLLAEKEKWGQAARLLTRAARAEPQELARWLQIARWQRLIREPQAAVKTLLAALRFNHSDQETPRNIGDSTTDKAETKANAAPHDARANELTALWQALAEAQLEAQNWNGCLEACRALLDLEPRHHFGREMTATALLHSGRIDEAAIVMRELLLLSPRDPLHRLKYATLLQLQGNSGQSSREFQRVADSHPDAPFVDEAHDAIETLDHIQIQQVLIRAGTETEFREQLQSAFEAALPDNGFHLSEAGRESLRHILGDGSPDYGMGAPPRIH